jgi:hypothetical protein
LGLTLILKIGLADCTGGRAGRRDPKSATFHCQQQQVQVQSVPSQDSDLSPWDLAKGPRLHMCLETSSIWKKQRKARMGLQNLYV